MAETVSFLIKISDDGTFKKVEDIDAVDEEGHLLGRKITIYIKHIICVAKEGLWEEYDL